MTQTTLHRQLSILIGGILSSYKIDNLQLEIDLVSSVHRMVHEKDPRKWVEVREDVLAGLLKGAFEENEMAQMETRVKKSMKISCDGRSRYSEMLRFLMKKDKEGQTVEKYAQWCESNPFSAPKFFQIADRPDRLMETWEMAFVEQADESMIYKKVANVEEEKAVPNPYQKPEILRQKGSGISQAGS